MLCQAGIDGRVLEYHLTDISLALEVDDLLVGSHLDDSVLYGQLFKQGLLSILDERTLQSVDAHVLNGDIGDVMV